MALEHSTYADLLLWARPEVVTEKNYARLSRRLDALMRLGTKPRAAVRRMVDLLSQLLEAYELERFPTPRVSGVEMLSHVIESREQSRAAFARDMGVSPQLLSNVLNGRREVSKQMALKLGRALKMDPLVFLAMPARPAETGERIGSNASA